MKIKRFLNLTTLQKKLIELGLNQSNIADKLSVSRETVSKWFKGVNQPSPGKLLKLSKILKLKFDDILTIEYVDRPLAVFRKNRNAKTTEKDMDYAVDLGNAIESLIPYIQLDTSTKPSVLLHPYNDYEYINEVVERLRKDFTFNKEILEVKDIITIFHEYHSIIIPVLWGENKRHVNALRIYLPESMTTWVYINLNTNIYDFKFWLTHELGHVLAVDLSGKQAECFADSFAGGLLFPQKLTEDLYDKLTKEKSWRLQIDIIINKAKQLYISPLTIYLQIKAYTEHYRKSPIELQQYIFKFDSKFKSYFPTVAEKVIGSDHPKAEDYINAVSAKFKSPFFAYLRQYIEAKSPSASFIQNLLDVPMLDAQNIHYALTHTRE